jgi:CheY-like chemotaxis protein
MQSGLHGKLEELGLDEILQIIAVSRRTGKLNLKSRGREAVLEFRDGLLVRISSTGFTESLGELLVKNGSVSPEVVKQALAIQQQERFRERIGSILHNRFNVDLQIIEQTVREQIRNVLMTLFTWTDGTFDCSQTDVETVDAAYLDPLQFILEMGGGVLLEESDTVEDDSKSVNSDEPVKSSLVSTLPELVIVDDDSALANAISNELKNWFEVKVFTRLDEAFKQVDLIFQSNSSPLFIVDLIMPKKDGAGVLGGLELIRLLHKKISGVKLYAVSDFNFDEAEQEIEKMGYRFFDKPRRGDVAGELFTCLMRNLKDELNIKD